MKLIKKLTVLSLTAVLTAFSGCSAQNAAFGDAVEVSGTGFSVRQPSDLAETVGGGRFGFDPSAEDNSEAFRRAAKYLKKHPNTELLLETGVYHFAPAARIELSGIQNAVIDGNGSEFIFATENYFDVLSCDTLEIRNLTVDWDWEKGGRLASVARVAELSDGAVIFEFPESGAAQQAAGEVWETMNQMDPQLFTPGCTGGAEYWGLSSSVTDKKYLGNNLVSVRFTGGDFSHLAVGQVYLIRHRLYAACVFYTGGHSRNITYRGICIYGAYGSGFVAGGGAAYMLFTGIQIGLRPGTEDQYRISTTVDAFHIADTKGHFILENCDISFQGDDCLNVHDNVGVVEEIAGKRLTVACMQPSVFAQGTVIAFKNGEDFSDYPVTATVKKGSPASGRVVLTLDQAADGLAVGAIAYSRENDSGNYVIRNNYFHECRARGLLLGSDNGLVENNRFYKTQGAALRIAVDIGDSWMEGTGVERLIIRNNSFESCNVNDWSSVIEFVANNGGKVINGACFRKIELSENTFSEFPSFALTVSSAADSLIRANTFRNETELPRSHDRGRITVSGSENVVFSENVWVESAYMPQTAGEILFS